MLYGVQQKHPAETEPGPLQLCGMHFNHLATEALYFLSLCDVFPSMFTRFEALVILYVFVLDLQVLANVFLYSFCMSV